MNSRRGASNGCSFVPVINASVSYSVHRIAGFAVISLLAAGFSPILAYGLSLLNGRGGLAGWSWIFVE